MLRRDFMPRSHNAALEQREGGFYGISVNVAMRVLAGMVDSLVKVLLHFVERVRIDGRFIGENHFHVATNVRVDDIPHSLGLGTPCPDQPQIPVALANANDYSLVALWTPPASLAANVDFVNLDLAAKFLRRYFEHGSANPVREVPCCLVGHFQHALELVRGHSLAGFGNQVGREEPLPQRQVRVMEDSSSGHAKLVMA